LDNFKRINDTLGQKFYTQDINDGAVRRLTLENELRWALERGELSLNYQPRIWIFTAAQSAEWRHSCAGTTDWLLAPTSQ